MTFSPVLSALSFFTQVFLQHCSAQVDLCITQISAYKCGQGAESAGRYHGAYKDTSQLVINTDKISVANPYTGARIEVLEVPGRYRMTFNDVTVKSDMTYLMADMELTLIPDGLNFPIQILNKSCDQESHFVEQRGHTFCRYCDLCDIAERIDSRLERKNVLVGKSNQVQWDGICQTLVAGKTYQWSRYLNLPDPKNFKDRYGADMGDLLRQGLSNGKGTIKARLRMLSLKDDMNQGTSPAGTGGFPGGRRPTGTGASRRRLLMGVGPSPSSSSSLRSSSSRGFGRGSFSSSSSSSSGSSPGCFNDCLRTRTASQCVIACQERRKQQAEQETKRKIGIEGPKCRKSQFYNPTYVLSACYDIDFKFTATQRAAGFFSKPNCRN